MKQQEILRRMLPLRVRWGRFYRGHRGYILEYTVDNTPYRHNHRTIVTLHDVLRKLWGTT